jgi:branched-chain amino acid aminotransferase
MSECISLYYLNNRQILSSASFSDSFLQHPFYLYEVFRVIDGVPLFIDDHEQRFLQSLHIPHQNPSDAFGFLKEDIHKLIELNALKEGNMKLVFLHDEPASLMAYVNPHQYPTDEEFENGVSVGFMEAIRENPNAKVMDTALRSHANVLKQEQQVYETLLVNEDGCVTEGSRSNVFFIKENQLITPPLEQVLPGITRLNIFRLCQKLNIEVIEKCVSMKEVLKMNAVFISGTSRKILPVKQIENTDFNISHPLLLHLKKAFNEFIAAYIQQHRTI